MKYSNYYLFVLLTLILTFFIFGCSSSEKIQNISAEDRFEMGKKLFDDEDYLEAKNEFEIVKLQFPGSAVADDAQYYLAECYFKRGEYLLASEEYQWLKRNMSSSPFVPLAQYKIGLCFYHLSPKSYLDQQYTYRAFDELQTFIDYYPTHELVPEAEKMIQEIINRLAKKDYDTAELYMKLEHYKAAINYFNFIIERYHDTQYAELALIGKIKALVMRKKYEEANLEIIKFMEKYQSSSKRLEVENIRDKIKPFLKNKSAG